MPLPSQAVSIWVGKPGKKKTFGDENNSKYTTIGWNMITLCTSLLSALLAKIKTTKYRRKKQAIVTSTEILPLSARFENSVKTLSKSIGFGAWMKFPPKDVKWLQRHLRWVVFESWLTFNKKEKNQLFERNEHYMVHRYIAHMGLVLFLCVD